LKQALSILDNMDAYPLSIKVTIDESQLRNHAQAELKAADDGVTDGRHAETPFPRRQKPETIRQSG
jgi:hypothetical protein